MSTRKVHHFTKSLPYDSSKGCPSGYHHREGYKSSTGMYVPPRCIRATTKYAETSKEFKARTLKKPASRLAVRGLSSTYGATRKSCAPGQVLRKAYVRRYTTNVRQRGYTVKKGNKTYRAYPKSGSTIVKASCVKNVGLKGKGPQVIGPLRRGELRKYGYIYREPSDVRHSALRKAAKEYGVLGIYRKLNAVAKLSKRSAPGASKIFSADRTWVKKELGPLKAF